MSSYITAFKKNVPFVSAAAPGDWEAQENIFMSIYSWIWRILLNILFTILTHLKRWYNWPNGGMPPVDSPGFWLWCCESFQWKTDHKGGGHTLAAEQSCPGRSGPEDWRKVWPSAPAATRNARAQPFCSSSLEKDESLAPHSVMGLSHPPGRSPRGSSGGHLSPFTVPCSLPGVSWMIRSSFLSLLGVLSSPGWVFFCSQKLFHNS